MLSLILSPGCPDWPRALDSRLGDSAPDHLTALGDVALIIHSEPEGETARVAALLAGGFVPVA